MNSLKRLLQVIGVAHVAAFSVQISSADAPPVRVMPLGDSITQGYHSGPGVEGGYRTRLFSLLAGSGFNPDFVGTLSDTNNPALQDVNHEGHPGSLIDGIRGGLDIWFKEVEDPDVILLNIGTNDFTYGYSVAATVARYKSLLAEIYAERPFAKIIASSLLPRTDSSALESLQVAFNQALPAIINEQVALGRQISFLDLHSALTAGDLADGVHPTPAGYQKLADAWLPAIANVITPLGTSNPPAIARVDSRTDLTHLTVRFSKPVDDSAASLSNFSLSGGVSILQAELDAASKRLVTLTTSPQVAGNLYTLTVSDIHDRTPAQNQIFPASTFDFTSRTLIDGSFEANGQAWDFSGSNQVVGSPLKATDGTKLVVFNGGETPPNGVASQQFPTIPGKKYTLDFDIGANGSTTVQALNVQVAGSAPIISQTEQVTGPGGSATTWDNKSLEFVANSATTQVSFTDTSPTTSSVDLLLDDVRLNLETNPILTVTSSPATGVGITVSPNDLSSNGNGSTNFTRTYSSGAAVSLTAPATSGGLNFQKWQNNGADYSFVPATSVTLTADATMKAAYGILANPSFEVGSPANLGPIDGWTMSGNFPTAGAPFAYLPDGGYPATVPNGARLLVFNGAGDVFTGSVSQTFATTPGQSYSLGLNLGVFSSSVAGRNQRLVITVAGATTLLSQAETVSSTTGTAQLASRNYTFTADSTSTTLTLADGTSAVSNNSAADLLVDNIRLAVVLPNTAPIAVNDSYSTTADVPLTVVSPGVLGNDTDSESDPLTAVVVAGPANGSLTLNPGGSLTYTPNSGYVGVDSFTYQANDGTANSNVATVSITVNAAGILANGSFELGSPANLGTLTGWTQSAVFPTAGAPFGYVPDSGYPATPADGIRLLVFNGGGDNFSGSVSQQFATTPGQSYSLDLNLGVFSGGVAGRNQALQVTVAGATTLVSQLSGATSTTGTAQLTPRNFTFIADSNQTTLTLADGSTGLTNNTAADLLVDNVRITAGAINTSPVAVNDSYSTTTNVALNIPAAGVLSNDTDAESNPLTAVLVAGPSNGTLNLNSNGSFTYTPTPAYSGSDSFTYRANDGLTNSNIATVSITVSASGAILTNGSFELGSPANLGPLTGWTQSGVFPAAGAPLGYVPDGSYPVVVPEGVRILIFNAGGNVFTGSVSQQFATTPGQSYSLDLNAGVFSGGSTGKNQALQITVAGSATLLSQTETVSSNAGTAVLAPKSYTFIADSAVTTLTLADASGTVGNNSGADLLVDNVRITAGLSNAAPVAVNDSYSTLVDTALNVTMPGVLSNDTDTESDPLTATVVAGPTHGSLTLNTNGSFSYSPASGYSGADSFTYRANDGTSNSNIATVSISITVPVVNLVSNGSFELGSPTNLGTLTGWTQSGIYPAAGAPFGYVPDGGYPAGVPDGVRLLVMNGAGDNFSGSVSQQFATTPGQAYSLDLNVGIFSGGVAGKNQRLQVTVAGSATLVSKLENVTSTAGAAQLAPKSYSFIADSALTTLTLADASASVSPNAGADLLVDFVRVAPVSNPRTLTVTTSPVSSLPVTVSPADLGGNANGTSSFTRVFGNGAVVTLTAPPTSGAYVFQKWQKNAADFTTSNIANVTLDASYTLNAVYLLDNSPRTTADSYTTDEDVQLTVPAPGILANDLDPNALPITAVMDVATSHGALFLNSDGSFNYLPDSNYNGPDSFTYHASNGSLDSPVTTVNITVNSVNDAPTATAQSITTDEDVPALVTIAGSDPEGATLSFSIVAQPQHGSLTGTAPNLTYTPAANYNGSDSFTFKTSDGSLDSATATVSITINSIEDIPLANSQTLSMTGATSLPITLTGVDPEGSPITYSIVSGPTQGILTGTAPNLTYKPLETYVGTDSFTFKVNDGIADSALATVSITVNSIVANGSFEAVSGTSPNFTPDNWTVTSSNLSAATYEIKTAPTPQDGIRLAAFNTGGRAPNAIFSQTFATTPGRSYTLVFELGIHTFDVTSRQQAMGVTLSGITSPAPATQTITRTGTAGGLVFWETKTIDFTPGSATTTLQLRDLSTNGASGAVDMLLDKVRVIPKNTRLLTVASSPDPGVNVTVSPADINSASSAATGFSRTYLDGTVVSLSVPAAIGAKNFQKWQRNGNDFAVTPATTVTLSANYTMTAVYVPNVPPVAVADTYSTDEDTALVIAAASGVLANDTDAEAVALTAVVDVSPAHGSLSLNSNGGFTYTPAANYFGPDSFTYHASDGVSDSAVTTVSLTVNSVNDAPVAVADSATTSEDTELIIAAAGVLANDSDIESAPLTAVLNAGPAHGSLTLNSDGSFGYLPAANYNGSDSFTYHANDGTADSNIVTVSISITAVNDVPVASAQSVSTDEDIAKLIELAGSDADGNSLTYSVITGPAHGVLTGSAPNLTYTPDANYNGPDEFTFKANDGTVDSPPATVSITVSPVNDIPLANAQSVNVDEDSAIGITLSGSDVETPSLTYSVVESPQHGTLTGTAPNLIYAPAADYNGTDSFTFKANDGTADSLVATISITVAPLNDAPVAAAQSVSTDEDIAKSVVLSGTDVDLDILTFAVVTGPSHGSLSGTAPNLTYTPDANYNGSDEFTFKASDGTLDSAPATVSITVAAVNDIPVASTQSVNVNEDDTVGITLSATDVESSSLTFSISTPPSHGTLSGTAPDLVYSPAANYHGTDSFSFIANDGTEDSLPAEVSVTVASVNDAPVAAAQSVSTDEDLAKGIVLSGSDADLDSLTYSIVTGPAHGSLSGTAPNLTYTPSSDYNGTDEFTFKVNDGTVDSPAATVSITVVAVNDAPVAVAQSVSTDEDVAKSITLAGTDVDLNSLTYSIVSGPSHGSLSGTAPDLTYTPVADYNGADEFTFKVNDGTVDSQAATVSITVVAVNDAPVAAAQSVSTDEDVVKSITLAGTDVDLNSLSYSIVSGPSHGSLSGTAPDLTYTPVADYNGADEFTFKVNDGTVDSPAATVSITVVAVNDTPVAVAQSVSTDEDVAKSITLAGTDVDLNSLSYSIVSGPSHGSLSGTAPDLTYTPAADYNGADEFTFKVNDGTVDSPAATVSITVAAVNDAPVAAAQSVSTDEDVAKSITLAGTDVELQALTFSVVTNPAHGSLSGTAPNLTYTPAANYNGPDEFTFKVNDGTLESEPATVSINVSAVNDIPVAAAQSVNVNEDGTVGITLAAADVETASLTFAISTPPSHGTLSGTAPNLVYTPEANYHGPDSFTFIANDGVADSLPAEVTITVASVNDTPTATAQTLSLNEDGTLSITLSGIDIDSDDLTFSHGEPSHGTLSGTVPNLTYTPAANYNGADSFSFVANDGTADSAPALISITVNSVNDTPVASAQSVSLNEDGSLPITLSGTDIDLNSLTYSVVTGPSHGSLSGSAPNLTYTPAANYNGSDSFTFKVNDGTVDSEPATVSITVTAVNDAPVGNGDSYTTSEDSPLVVPALGVLTNDTDVESSSLTAIVDSLPTHGSLTLNSDGGFSYTPAANYNGADSFSYHANDGTANSAVTTVDIAITAVNDAPVASAQSVDVSEDGSTAITLAGSDQEGSALTFNVVSAPQHGSLSGTAPNLTYTPAANYFGPDSFSFTTNDGSLDSAPAVVSITVTPVNDVPVANAQSISLDEDTSVAVTLSGSDVEGSSLTFSVTVQPQHGTLSGTAPNLTYTPAANYNGPDSFTYVANDGTVNSAPAVVSITVAPVPDNSFGEWLATFGLANGTGGDADKDSITNAVEYVIGGNPASRADQNLLPTVSLVTADPDGNTVSDNYLLFTYRRTDLAKADPNTVIRVQWSTTLAAGWANAIGTPGVVVVENNDAAAAGIDLVNVFIPRSLAVNGKLFARLMVNIDYVSVNVPPVASPQSISVNEDSSVPVVLTASDANADSLSYSIVSAPQHGSLSGTAPNLTYTPAANYNGPDSFTFKANDGSADTTPATISITVNAQEEFTQWMNSYSLSAGPTVDSDKDSVSNIVEYVIGGNPSGRADANLLPTVSLVTADPDGNTVSDSYLLFTYRRTALAHTDPSTSIRVLWSTNLTGTWTNAVGTSGVVVLENPNGAAPGVDLVSVYIPRSLAVGGKLFTRLQASVALP